MHDGIFLGFFFGQLVNATTEFLPRLDMCFWNLRLPASAEICQTSFDRSVLRIFTAIAFGYAWELELPLQTEGGTFEATVLLTLPPSLKPQC